ncbi:MAG: AAA family ATPase, partial [Chloroflexota bacterium]
ARLGQSSSYVIHQETLNNQTGENEQEMNLLQRDQIIAKIRNGAEWKSVNPELTQAETLLSWYATPFAESDVLRICREQLASWQMYHYFNTQREALVRQAPVARHEKMVSQDGANLVQVLHTLYSGDRQFKEDLNLAMNAAFGDDFVELIFPPASDQRIQMRIRWKSLRSEQSAADLSDGTLHFLYLIAILANPNPPAALIAIDEPENGLHPSMLPIIAEYARSASRRTQVIITTHSAELLDAFSEYEPTVTVAKWAEGQTQLDVLSGERLRYWLQDYTLGKLYRSGELEELL